MADFVCACTTFFFFFIVFQCKVMQSAISICFLYTEWGLSGVSYDCLKNNLFPLLFFFFSLIIFSLWLEEIIKRKNGRRVYYNQRWTKIFERYTMKKSK